MIKIGDKERIFAETFIVPEGETATADFPFPLIPVPIIFNLVLQFAPKEGEGTSASWVISGSKITLTFKGWDNMLGTGLKAPAKLGDIGGFPIGFNCAHFLLGAVHYIHIELYKGGNYDVK